MTSGHQAGQEVRVGGHAQGKLVDIDVGLGYGSHDVTQDPLDNGHEFFIGVQLLLLRLGHLPLHVLDALLVQLLVCRLLGHHLGQLGLQQQQLLFLAPASLALLLCK